MKTLTNPLTLVLVLLPIAAQAQSVDTRPEPVVAEALEQEPEFGPDTLGELPTLVIDLDLGREPRAPRIEELGERVFAATDSINAWVEEVSRGLAWVDGEVIYLHMPELEGLERSRHLADGSSVSTRELYRRILQEASLQVDLEAFDRVLLPLLLAGNIHASRCQLESLGQPGLDGSIWISTGGSRPNHPGIHEFGHTLGLSHSNSLNCEGTSMGSRCRTESYGARYDVMASGGAEDGHFNVIHQEQLGWLETAAGDGVLVEEDGEFLVEPLEGGVGSRFLRIPDQEPGSDDAYYVSCRVLDPTVVAQPEHCQLAVYLRSGDRSLMLDMDLANNEPPDHPGWAMLFQARRDPMTVGQVFEDSARGVRFTHLGMDGEAARVRVELSPALEDTPPTAEFLQPEVMESVAGPTVWIELDAEDDRGVVQVEFLRPVRGVTRIDRTDVPGAYILSWDTRDTLDGATDIVARVTDSSGQTTEVRREVVLSNRDRDQEPPVLSWITPRSGEVVPRPETVFTFQHVSRHPLSLGRVYEWTRSVTRVQLDVTDNSSLANNHWDVLVRLLFIHQETGERWVVLQEFSRSFGFFFPLDVYGIFYRVDPDFDGGYTPNTHADPGWDSSRSRSGLPYGNYEVVAYGRDQAGNVGRSPAIVMGVNPIPDEEPVAEEGEFVRGDANGDDVVDLSDGMAILGFLFLGDELPPEACEDAADVNDNGRIDLNDAVRLFNFLFKGGPPPAYPFPLPAEDRTEDALGCGVN